MKFTTQINLGFCEILMVSSKHEGETSLWLLYICLVVYLY